MHRNTWARRRPSTQVQQSAIVPHWARKICSHSQSRMNSIPWSRNTHTLQPNLQTYNTHNTVCGSQQSDKCSCWRFLLFLDHKRNWLSCYWLTYPWLILISGNFTFLYISTVSENSTISLQSLTWWQLLISFYIILLRTLYSLLSNLN